MRLTTNDKLVQQRSTWARYLTFAGMGLLLASLVTSFMSDQIALAYGTLIGGFITAMIGSHLASKWIRPPRADQALEKSLKGFDNKHHLYNYLLPAEHVLVTPSGVLVFKTKQHDDRIFCRNGRWNRPWKWTRLFGALAQEPLGNPIVEMEYDVGKIQRLLQDKIQAPPIPVDGYVVFTHPRAQLTIDDPALPVVMADDLKNTLRKRKREALSPPALEQIEKTFNEYANAKAAK